MWYCWSFFLFCQILKIFFFILCSVILQTSLWIIFLIGLMIFWLLCRCSSKWYREVHSCLRIHEATIFISYDVYPYGLFLEFDFFFIYIKYYIIIFVIIICISFDSATLFYFRNSSGFELKYQELFLFFFHSS